MEWRQARIITGRDSDDGFPEMHLESQRIRNRRHFHFSKPAPGEVDIDLVLYELKSGGMSCLAKTAWRAADHMSLLTACWNAEVGRWLRLLRTLPRFQRDKDGYLFS